MDTWYMLMKYQHHYLINESSVLCSLILFIFLRTNCCVSLEDIMLSSDVPSLLTVKLCLSDLGDGIFMIDAVLPLKNLIFKTFHTSLK